MTDAFVADASIAIAWVHPNQANLGSQKLLQEVYDGAVLEVPAMNRILSAIVDDNPQTVKELLEADRGLATRLIREPKLYTSKILHWIYTGDTALHLAAAGYRVAIVQLLD